MDKRVIFAVAGAGKTTYIVNSLSKDKRSLILTYTGANLDNLRNKILQRFGGHWPSGITLMSYYHFLYRFCYKPFLADKIKARGIYFNKCQNRTLKQTQLSYYLTKDRCFYSNRFGFFLQNYLLDDIKNRIEKYFDEFIIDEIQDVAGRDFNFIVSLFPTKVNMLFVGDFYQHTYDTSRDGNTNKSLFDNQKKYVHLFVKNGITSDTKTLQKSWRCPEPICQFVRENLGIEIYSNCEESTDASINFLIREQEVMQVLENPQIVKLHFNKAAIFGDNHKNWGDTKGEDKYTNVCILLNPPTFKYLTGEQKSTDLKPQTKNRLYVAITRARRNVYFVEEKLAKRFLNKSQ
ncbi:MAG TPA: AAA family ATPase [Candidatus Aphodousia faecavium]|nr:AAA family ATPase [Candidatus Aphodousia faecavium]